jgi:hypothetical protein
MFDFRRYESLYCALGRKLLSRVETFISNIHSRMHVTKLEVVFIYDLRSWNNNNSVALVRERTIPTERPPLVGEVSANVCG